jgi:hypothetical protein
MKFQVRPPLSGPLQWQHFESKSYAGAVAKFQKGLENYSVGSRLWVVFKDGSGWEDITPAEAVVDSKSPKFVKRVVIEFPRRLHEHTWLVELAIEHAQSKHLWTRIDPDAVRMGVEVEFEMQLNRALIVFAPVFWL